MINLKNKTPKFHIKELIPLRNYTLDLYLRSKSNLKWQKALSKKLKTGKIAKDNPNRDKYYWPLNWGRWDRPNNDSSASSYSRSRDCEHEIYERDFIEGCDVQRIDINVTGYFGFGLGFKHARMKIFCISAEKNEKISKKNNGNENFQI